MNNRTLQNTKGEQKNIITIAAAPAAHTSYLSSPPAAILHEKAQSVVLWLSPQHNPHATFMQPLQCVSRHHVSNPHVWTHIGNKSRRQSCSHSSAICDRRFQNTLKLHTHTRAQTHPKQLQATVRPREQKSSKRTARNRRGHAHAHAHAHTHTHTPTRTRTRTRARARAHTHAHAHMRTHARAHTRTRAHAHTRARAHAHTHTPTHAHTHAQGTFHRRLRPLFTEKPKVSYSGFLSNPSPMQHSCSHYIAFCIITCLTRMSRRMATKRDTNHAAISLRSATTDSKTPDNYTYCGVMASKKCE